MKLKIALFINIMLFALVMGVFWGTWISLDPAHLTYGAATFLDVGNTMIANLAPTMPFFVIISLLSSLPVLYGQYRQKNKGFYFSLIGFLLMLTATITTLAVNVPIDNEIKTWTISTIPANWKEIWSHWAAYHTFRTFFSISALGFAVTGGLFPRAATV